MLVLLSESTQLYARLALSVAAREREREREGQNMTLEVIVRSMTHELHQPLSAIMLNGDAAAVMLSQSPPPLDELRASLQDISADGRRASEIVASTRAVLTGVVRQMALFDVNMLVRETLALTQIDRRILDVELRLQLAPQLPQIWGNRAQLQQLLTNLLTQAIESMAALNDRPRLLTLRTAMQDPAAISIQVADNGIGNSDGTGLELAPCRSSSMPMAANCACTRIRRMGVRFL